jgi:hypothetical protein
VLAAASKLFEYTVTIAAAAGSAGKVQTAAAARATACRGLNIITPSLQALHVPQGRCGKF